MNSKTRCPKVVNTFRFRYLRTEWCQRKILEAVRAVAKSRGMTKRSPFRYFKTSPEIIRLAVMLYVRYPLSLRNQTK